MKLILGVHQASYTDPKGISGSELETVQDVARAIERRYGIMTKFVQMNNRLVGDAVAASIVEKLSGNQIDNKTIPAIADAFKSGLQNKIFDGRAFKVPTMAAKAGRRWRKNSPNQGPGRPSFIDTGTYKSAMDAVISDA